MDKTIGRLVYAIKGSVSANNYVTFDNLQLTGNDYYLQYSLLKPVATFHFEIITSSNISFRISFSTLYNQEKPKFLGRSLR
jgi:hypothetical protein